MMISLQAGQMRRRSLFIPLILMAILPTEHATATAAPSAGLSESESRGLSSYADSVDLVIASPLVIRARIEGRKKVNIAAADGEASPISYYLTTAQVETLIRGDSGVAPTLTFLVRDVPKGQVRPDYLRKKVTVMLFARPGRKPGEIQLTSRNAIQPWTEDLEQRTRSITSDLLRADSPPAITGVGDAFHIAGTIAGESETQIFLKTENGVPVSLSILRRPGEAPHWGVSLGEIVDESAVPPSTDTLLWYRLACGLPPALPNESTRSLPLLDAEAARRDYKLVMESLGRCGRTL